MIVRNRNSIIFKRWKRKILYFITLHKVVISIVVFLLFTIIGINILYKKYIDNPKNIVKNVYFDKKISDNINLFRLMNDITNVFSGTNTAKNKILSYKKEKELIIKKYKILSDIEVETINSDSVKINFSLKKPRLVFIGSGELFPVYDNDFIYSFNTDYITGLNLDTKNKIYLPSYIKTDDNLKYIFWKTSSEKLINYIQKIQEIFPKSKLFYIVGGENIKALIGDKIYYFSLSKDINKQINQLKIFVKKYNNLYKNAKIIDLGNLDKGIYIKGK